MKKIIMLISIVLLVAGGGVWLTLQHQPNSGAAPSMGMDAPRDSVVLDEPVAAPQVPSAPSNTVDSSASAKPAEQVSNFDQALGMVDRLSELVSGDMSDEDEALLYELLDELKNEAMRDPAILKEIIDEFSLNPSSDLAQHLAPILAAVKGPEVEAMALDLARFDATQEEQVAGLALMSQLGVANEAAFNVTRAYLSKEDADPEVLRSAIYAMPVLPVASIESGMVVANLSSLALDHPDDGVRFNSVSKIVEWAKEPQDLEAVVRIMHDKERSEGDRIGAAAALAGSTVGGDAMRELFMARMADKNELWEVRRSAAEALERFTLFEEDFEQLESFKHEDEKKQSEIFEQESVE